MNQLTVKQHPSPDQQERQLASVSRELLSSYAIDNMSLKIAVLDTIDSEPIELPASAVELLLDILEVMASGQGIALIPEDTELTTVEAATLLNVSRPYLIGLLDTGIIPYRKVGSHRRIRSKDILMYKDQIDREREAILDELVADAQEADMVYDK